MKSFIFCGMNKVDLILGATFFETHTIYMRHKLVRLVVCLDGKEKCLKLTKALMARGSKLNLAQLTK